LLGPSDSETSVAGRVLSMDFSDNGLRAPEGHELADGSLPAGKSPAVRACHKGPNPVLVPVVLSGGAGTRLWPYSTEDTPKQFLSFTGTSNLFQLTLDRIRDRSRFTAPIVVGSVRHASLCERELLDDGDDALLILEPYARNTAAAIAMAAHAACDLHGPDAVLLVMPSDHVIEDVEAFHEAVTAGAAAAGAGRLVTFGIVPTDPQTGFGYIEAGPDLARTEGVREVLRFVEKPDLQSATEMVADGRYLWNAGIFLFRTDVFLEELAAHAPAIAAAAKSAVENGRPCGGQITADLDSLEHCPNESVDYAVMEHSRRVAVVPMAPGWSDLGSWDALAELLKSQESHGPVTALDCDDCYIRSDGLRVAALGIRDLIVVASGGHLLILPRGRSQEVKKLLSAMDTIAA
jgi:mannose-1-phosphate guanylyltransferase